MNILALAEKRAKLQFDLDGETVNAEFYPHKMTPEYRARLLRAADEGSEGREQDDGDAQMLADILIDWDVTEGDKPFPPTIENLKRAPQTLITRTALEILAVLGKLAAPPRQRK